MMDIKQNQKKQSVSMLGTSLPQKMDTLPREVIKWIQSLDLTYSVKNVKRDFNNGFLVAEILSRYYPVTDNRYTNYKAVHINHIDNGFSMAKRKENWIQIQKFLSKIKELHLKISDIDSFIKNENGEILVFIISLYQQLTKREVPILYGKVIPTDIDSKNKLFLLKDIGEIERLNKTHSDNINNNTNTHINNATRDANDVEMSGNNSNVSEKKKDEFQNSKNFFGNSPNVVMQGFVKPIETQLTQLEKGFNVKVSEPKIFEQSTRVVLQPRDELSNGQRGGKPKNDLDNAVFISLFSTDKDLDPNANRNDNPFIKLDKELNNKIKSDFPKDYNAIRFYKGGKFTIDFFKSINILSNDVINFALQSLIETIDYSYNTLNGKNANDYINIFIILYAAYINLELSDEENKKFSIMHEGMKGFLSKSLMNKTEEMNFIFKNVIIEKIFLTINDTEYYNKINYLCELLFCILEPNDQQQVQLFKTFKDKIKNDEILYECFSILHNKIIHYSDSLIDGTLFYILNGISNENVKIRYCSLNILLKYSQINVNYVINLSNKISKLAKRERDRENCLLIIKIVSQTLKTAYKKKNKSKEEKKSNYSQDKNQHEDDAQNYKNELSFANKTINEIVKRFKGDHLFILLFSSVIYDYLFDNIELYKILIISLLSVNDSIHRFFFYEEDLDKNMKMKYEGTIFRNPVKVEKIKGWNKAFLFQAFEGYIAERNVTELNDIEYDFVKYITSEPLDVSNSDMWKPSIKFSSLVIQDLNKLEKTSICLGILEAFILCEPIQKFIFDDWFEYLNKVCNIVSNYEREDGIKSKEIIIEYMNRWIKNAKISQNVRDNIRKLIKVLKKETIEHVNYI